jgi:hypothetical protein
LNSNHVQATTDENSPTIYMTSQNSTNMSTFKTINSTILPSKPSDIKKRSNNRKQIYATLNSNNNNNSSSIIPENEISSPPPPPPPFPVSFDLPNKIERPTSIKSEPIKTISDFQTQIEEAKIRLKKVSSETSPKKTMIKSSHTRKLKMSLLKIKED